ncbi:PPC domain-containing protein [Sorangium sp. So ce1335]|uniref:PPC domain-containing protein n=1 Tax=Sorangium sp. So ce1335 TaxID=3133335 RepID=UPI003F5E710C
MRSIHFLGCFVLGAIAATAAACGGDDDSGAGGQGGAGGAGGATSSSSTTGGVTTTTSSGGEQGDQNDSIETAESIEIDGDGVQETLDPVDTDQDFYRFTGTQGQILYVTTDAKPEQDETDPTYPDLVVSLLDAQGNQIARNDDPPLGGGNDSRLITVLPADGDYYVVVEECTSALGPSSCAPAEDIENFDYAIGISSLDPAAADDDSLIEDKEPNDDETQALPLHYEALADDTGYYTTFLIGDFESATDVDVYSFTLPEAPAAEHGLKASFLLSAPPGAEGSGSTVDVSEIAVFDAADLTTPYAKVDPSKGGSIEVPVKAGEEAEYLVFVKRPQGEVGANDFYVLLHNRLDISGREAQESTNNDATTPEGDLYSFDIGGGGIAYTVDGEIAEGDAPDTDYYALPLPEGADATWKVSAFCGAQRHGSGLRELKVTLLNGDGTELGDGYTHTESEAADLEIVGKDLPATPAENRLIAMVSAGTPAADVTSRSYDCVFGFIPGN